MPQETCCYVIRNPLTGLIYRCGEWVNCPPYEIFIPVHDGSIIQNIALALGGELVDESEVQNGAIGDGTIGPGEQSG